MHGFGIRNPANGIRNPTIIVIQNLGCWLWNPESMDVESGIHRHGIRNPQRGIQNPRISWITLHGANKTFHVLERTRTDVKCTKMKNARAKRAKLLFFVVEYHANM